MGQILVNSKSIRVCKCWWCCFLEGNVVQARPVVPTVMMNVISTDALKKHDEETRNGNGWKWSD